MLFYLSATRIPVFIDDPRLRTRLCARLPLHLKMNQLRGNFAFHSLLTTRVLAILHQGTDSQLLRFGYRFICVHLRNLAQRSNNFSLHYFQIQRVGIDIISRLHIHTWYLRELWSRMFVHLAELNSFLVFTWRRSSWPARALRGELLLLQLL